MSPRVVGSSYVGASGGPRSRATTWRLPPLPPGEEKPRLVALPPFAYPWAGHRDVKPANAFPWPDPPPDPTPVVEEELP